MLYGKPGSGWSASQISPVERISILFILAFVLTLPHAAPGGQISGKSRISEIQRSTRKWNRLAVVAQCGGSFMPMIPIPRVGGRGIASSLRLVYIVFMLARAKKQLDLDLTLTYPVLMRCVVLCKVKVSLSFAFLF